MLKQIPLALNDAPLPRSMRRFIDEAERRIADLRETGLPKRFESSDAFSVWNALNEILARELLPNPRFCEWGCGLGIAAGLAAGCGFKSQGVEIDHGLVNEARRLAGDFALPVTFRQGDYQKAPASDLVFAYPWPDEEEKLKALFDEKEASGSLFLVYRGIEDLVLFEKS